MTGIGSQSTLLNFRGPNKVAQILPFYFNFHRAVKLTSHSEVPYVDWLKPNEVRLSSFQDQPLNQEYVKTWCVHRIDLVIDDCLLALCLVSLVYHKFLDLCCVDNQWDKMFSLFCTFFLQRGNYPVPLFPKSFVSKKGDVFYFSIEKFNEIT